MKANGTSREVYAAGTIHPTKKGDVKVIEFKSSREVVVQFLTEGQEITTVQAASIAKGSVSRKKQVRSKVAANSGAEVICNRCGTTDESIIGYDKARHNGRSLNCKPCANELKQTMVRKPFGLIGKIINMQRLSSRVREHHYPTYTTEELYKWAMNNNLMHYFNLWKVKGYTKPYSPSIDRLDNTKPYTFDNIRLMTWRNNQHLAFIDRSIGFKLTNLLTDEVIMCPSQEQLCQTLHVNKRDVHKCMVFKLKGYLVTPLTTTETCEGTIRAYMFDGQGTGKLFENVETCCKEMGISEERLRRAMETFEPIDDWCYYTNVPPTELD